jgi:glycosyltransferase involved in cell wall biosynthesis
VSVLLPTFRRGASGLFLKAARSVLDSDLRELELIVVDDGSTDGTADQIRSLMAEDARVGCLHHPRNVGLPAVGEFEAYRRARADHIAFGFDDDIFFPSALRQLLEAARGGRHPVVHGHVELVVRDPNTGAEQTIPLGADGTPQVLLRSNNYIANNSVLLHREVLETVGLYDPHICVVRLCDWDLMRRIAERYELRAVNVAVGRELGPSTSDSLGHTYGVEYWSAVEWMQRPRDEALRPDRFEDYDVTAVPEDVSRETRLVVEELGRGFSEKFWYRGDAEDQRRTAEPGLPDGRLLVVTASYDASTTLYFDHVPARLRPRIRVVHYGAWADGLPSEMIGASAVVFVRALFNFAHWIEVARRLKIPHYYFLDDNLMVLREEIEYRQEYDSYSDKEVRRMLESFSGVLLSTPPLADYFRERSLHPATYLYPPVAANVDGLPRPVKEDSAPLRIGYIGGAHRDESLRQLVLPALQELARAKPVELVATGPDPSSLGGQVFPVTVLPAERSYDVALRRMASRGIDVLVHPGSENRNSPFKTQHVLLNAAALGAAAVLSDCPPYDRLAPTGAALLCRSEPASWAEALTVLSDSPATRGALVEGARRFCRENYSGRQNEAVLSSILRAHPSAGLALRDARYRQALRVVGVGGPAHPAVVPVPVQGWMSAVVEASVDELRRVTTMVGSFGGRVSGTLRLAIRDVQSRQTLREVVRPLRDVRVWVHVRFEFDSIPNARGRRFELRFTPEADGVVALYETSTKCRGLRRRVLRRLRRDRHADHLHVELG